MAKCLACEELSHRSPSLAENRLSWCAIYWGASLGETHRTGRGLAVSHPLVGPLKRRDECHERCNNHRDREEYDGGSVALSLVTHEILSLQRALVVCDGRSLAVVRLSR